MSTTPYIMKTFHLIEALMSIWYWPCSTWYYWIIIFVFNSGFFSTILFKSLVSV